MINTCKELFEKGWMPIPTDVFYAPNEKKRHKKPVTAWKGFIDDPKTYDFHRVTARLTSEATGVGVLTGTQRDGTFVVSVDLDPPEDEFTSLIIPDELHNALGSTLVTQTPSGGYHFYFKYTGAFSLTNKTNLFRKDKLLDTIIDLRAQGGLSVIGPTTLWRWNFKEDSQGKQRRTSPLSPTDKSYITTSPPFAPSELPELPQFIVDAFIEHELHYSTPTKAKNIYSNLLELTPPNKEKGESLHAILLSHSWKLISTYLDKVNTKEDADLLFERFKKDVAPIASSSTSSRDIYDDPKYLENTFYSALHKLKKSKNINYTLSSHLIDPLLANRQAQVQKGSWDTLQITNIINYSTHLFATNADQTNGFELSNPQFSDQTFWRSQHLIHFGTPHLPKIKPATFDLILSSLTYEISQASLPHNTARIIIDNWLTSVLTLEDEGDYKTALDQALHAGRGGYLDPTSPILIFKLTSLQTALRNEGYGSLSISRLAQILTKLNISPTKENQSLYICTGTQS